MTDEERKAIRYLKIYITQDVLYDNSHYKQIETLLNLIEKQEKAIDRMAKHIEKFTGSCPLDKCLWEECNKECENQMAECWKEYFMKEENK